MKRIIPYALTAALLLLGSSCVKEPVDSAAADGKDIKIQFKMGLPSEGSRSGGTRSLSADSQAEEIQIDQVGVLAFVKTGDGKFRYSYTADYLGKSGSDTEVEVVVMAKKYPGEQIFLILCNAADEIAAADIRPNEEIDAVLARIKCGADTAGEWPAKINGSAAFTPFPMYAKTSAQVISDTNREIGDFPLVRMIARADVTLAASVNNFTLVSAQVYNRTTYGYVPYDFSSWIAATKRVSAAAVPTENAFTGRPAILKPTVVYNAEYGADTRGEIKRSIYLFESKGVKEEDRLTGAAIIVGGKYGATQTERDAAPVTYYRIDIATDATPSGWVSQDILRNHCYGIEIQAVTTPGFTDPEDAYIGQKPIGVTVKVIDWGNNTQIPLGVDVLPSSNSFIVAPENTYAIPVFGQVQQAMDAGHLPMTWIDNSMNLGAYLVWCDNSDVNNVVSTSSLRIQKSSYSSGTMLYLTTGQKIGNAVVAVTSPATSAEVSAGVKKYNGTAAALGDPVVRWSWHIWVTDYNPLTTADITQTGVQGSDAQNNKVYVYTSTGTPSATWPDNGATNVFMDRNLGAHANTANGLNGYYQIGLMYQWGRKDPISLSSKDWTSTVIAPRYNAAGAVSFADTDATLQNMTRNPGSYGAVNKGSIPDIGGASWGGNQLGDYSTKSIYDPCPKGWRVPKNGAYNGLVLNASTYSASPARHTSASLGTFWINGIIGAGPVVSAVASSASTWTSTAPSNTSYAIWYNTSSVALTSASNNINGHVVRCVQDLSATPAGPTLTTDSEGRKIFTDGATYNVKVTSNTAWIASIKKGTNEVTIGDSEVLGQPLLNTATGFNGGLVTSYVSGGTAGTTTDKTITVKTVDYNSLGQYAEGDLVIVFRDKDTGTIIHETTIKVVGELWARSNIVWDAANNRLTFAVSHRDNNTIPANSNGVLFKWGSLVAIGPERISGQDYEVGQFPIGNIVYDPTNSYGYTYDNIPYISSTSAPFNDSNEAADDFAGYGPNGAGFDAGGRGDICRYITAQGWIKGKWRLPTAQEFNNLIAEKTSIIYGPWAYEIIPTGSSTYGNHAYGFFLPTSGRMLGLGATATDNVLNPSSGVYFPASNYRSSASSSFSASIDSYYWSGSSSGTTDANDLTVRSGYAVKGAHARKNATPIRCIRE